MVVINLPLVARLLSPALFYVGLIGLIPLAYSLITLTEGLMSFLPMCAAAIGLSQVLRQIGRHARTVLTIRDLFLFTVSLWTSVTVIAAIPIYLMLEDVSVAGSLFESASPRSTTVATVINRLETRPPAILLWRSILQFLGGIGFVVIGVAILPSFSLGGINIFKTESTSFDGNAKLTPHLKTMAFYILVWYLGNCVLCTVSYFLCGLDLFLALNAAMCTVATGGMMPLDASMNDLSAGAHYTAIVFMYLGSVPFLVVLASLSVNLLKLRYFFKDEQVRGYTLFILVLSAAIALSLVLKNDYPVERAIRVALFNVVSILSTSGFALEDFTAWNSFSTILFMIIFAIGGCSGSTSGGLKYFRLQVCFAMFKSQLVKSVHPHRAIEPRFNGRRVSPETLRAVITYLVSYVLVLIASSILATLMGLNITDAITASITCLSNVGPAMGYELGPTSNFAYLSDSLHLLFAFDMLMGRLEIIPVLLCMTRMFWKF